MSEHHPEHNVEHSEKVEQEAIVDQKPEQEISPAHHEANRQNALENSRNQIDQLATSSESVTVGEAKPEPADQVAVNKDLKELAYSRILTRTRKNLPLADRWLSKLTHQPVVDKISTMGEKTIARPAGVLSGSVVAFIGSSILLYSSKHYGFRFPLIIRRRLRCWVID
jgi:hypothetical protein